MAGVIAALGPRRPRYLRGRCDRGAKRVDIGSETRWSQRDRHPRGIGEGDAGRVEIKPGLEDDDLITGLGEGQQGGLDRLGRTGRDDDLGVGINRQPVEPLLMLGDPGTKVGQSVHGRVLVAATIMNGGLGDLLDLIGSVGVGEPLPEIDGPELQGKVRHLTEDRGRVRLHPRNQGAGRHVYPQRKMTLL